MKKRNKAGIIISALLMVIGILLTAAGFFGSRMFGIFYKTFDYKNIRPEDLGKSVETNIFVYYDNIDLEDRTTQLVGDVNGDFAFLVLDFSALNEAGKDLYYSNTYQYITIHGTLRAMDDAEFKELGESLYTIFDEKYAFWDNPAVSQDEFRQLMMEQYIPYCIEVTSVGSFNWTPFIPAGIAVFLFALVLEFCFVFKLKKRIVLPVVYGIMILIPVIMFFNHIRTMLSITKPADGLYTMKNLECTDTREMLDSGSGSVNELIDWILDEHFYGMKDSFDESNFRMGCAAFAASTPEGDHLFGRNFDYMETDIVLVHSQPRGLYESIGIADLGVLGVGRTENISPDSPMGRMYMIITPYMVVDGMNEKGLGVGILELSTEETHQDNGKPDLVIYSAIRGILDNCASVDEALALLDSYDIHSDLGVDYHLFITDSTGRYVVVEWLGGTMTVTEHPSCTNSVIAPGRYFDMGEPDERIGIIDTCLGTDRILTESEAMDVLDKVHNSKITEWSCVYNLDDFAVSICLDGDYSKVYTFSAAELK